MTVLGWGREKHSGRYAPLENAGILRCAQNDDVKLATAPAKTTAKQRQRQRLRQRRNTGISPLRRQSAPPSVEMTFVMGGLKENKQRQEQQQQQRQQQRRNTGISLLRRQSAPPSVEMTFVMGGLKENK